MEWWEKQPSEQGRLELLRTDIRDIFVFFLQKPWFIWGLKIETSLSEDKVLQMLSATSPGGQIFHNRKQPLRGVCCVCNESEEMGS